MQEWPPGSSPPGEYGSTELGGSAPVDPLSSGATAPSRFGRFRFGASRFGAADPDVAAAGPTQSAGRRYRILVRDANRTIIGEIDDYQRLELDLRFNRPGSWDLLLDATTAGAALLTVGGGIVVERDGQRVFSGPVRALERQWDGTGNSIEYRGPDDTGLLSDRRGNPQPATAAPPYNSQAYDQRTGVVETILRQYVDVNGGPSALAPRRITGLTLAADQGRGTSKTGLARFDELNELAPPLALNGGNLGYRVLQVGPSLELQFYQPADKSASVKFSPELGNLRAYTYRLDAPEANYVYVLGGGEGTARVVVEGGDSASIAIWGRIEGVRDRRDTTDTGVLTEQLNTSLAEWAAKTALSISPIDTEAVAFGTSYSLGDVVTVVVDGEPISDVVREVHLSLTRDQAETILPTIGSPGAARTDLPLLGMFGRLRAMSNRVFGVERR